MWILWAGFFAVDCNGKTINRIMQFDSLAFGAYEIGLNEDAIDVTLYDDGMVDQLLLKLINKILAIRQKMKLQQVILMINYVKWQEYIMKQ